MPETLEPRQLLSGSVVINEIMHHPVPYNMGTEYVELYNAGDAPVDLSGWKLKGLGYEFGPVSIGPGNYLVVAADRAAFSAKYPGVANVVSEWTDASNVVHRWTGRLSNSREQIELEDASGKRVDAVAYADQGEWAVRERSRGVRIADRITRSGTTATVRMNTHNFRNGDRVEIWGASQAGYNGTFTVANAQTNTFDITVSGSPASPATGQIFVRQLTDLGHTGWSWVQWADGLGKSLEVINPAADNGSAQNWASSIADNGTPGARNSVWRADVAPLILTAQHSPAVPTSSQAVTVSAQIVDELDWGASAQVFWRVDGASRFTTATMYDDGLHNDGKAGDRLFGAILPAQANNTIVEFYLSATDAAGNTRTFPAPTTSLTQGANLLYQVDDTVYTGGQPFFKLIMTAAEAEELADIGSPTSSSEDTDAQMNATFISIDGTSTEVRYMAGVRNRGAGSRDMRPNNYRINFNTDAPWKGGLTGMNINGRYSMEEIAGSAIFRAAGMPAQDATPVQVRVNNVDLASSTSYDMFGSYSFLETQNTEMAENHWREDSSGNYYRGIRRFYSNTDSADFSYLGESEDAYRADYVKHSNVEDDDWSDIIGLARAFDPIQTPDDVFPQVIRQHVDVEQWLRYFALSSLMGDQETTLATGYGDDYDIYRGIKDPRFQVVVHDLDTIMGVGDTSPKPTESIFRAADVPAVKRLLTHPAFAPIYYAQFQDLINTVFTPERLNPLLDNALSSYVPAATIQKMKDFANTRINGAGGVLSQIPQKLTATSTLTVQNGYPRTTAATAALSGQSNVIETRGVRVNGRVAGWAWNDTKKTWEWNISGVPLNPGINRLLIQAIDEHGNEFERMYFDVWRDTSTMRDVSGQLPAGATTWRAADGPYHVTGTVTVPTGATLTIEPGTTVFFDVSTGLDVMVGAAGVQDGRLIAKGNEYNRIHFTRTPSATDTWNGIQFIPVSSSQAAKPVAQRADNQVSYANIEYANKTGHAIHANKSRFLADNILFANQNDQYVTADDSAMILSNSVFADITGDELVHFWGFPSDGYARIEGNYFGKAVGYNDIIDFTGGQRPGPIAQFLNNVFTGGPDDAIDLDGTDAHVEGNVFMHFHQDAARESKSHGVSTGTENGLTSDITVVRNLFYDMDHAILVKDGGFGTIINNTIVDIHKNIADATTAAINLYEPRSGQWEGSGVYLDGNISQDISRMFENADIADRPVDISVNNSIYPMNAGETEWPGVGNLHVDPRLLKLTGITNPLTDFRLRPGSPAIGTGPNGLDMGGVVPTAISISGEPVGTTTQTQATLTVGGPHIYSYRYRVNDGPWSAEVTNPMLTITGLALKNIVSGRTGTATATVPNHGLHNGDMVNIAGVSNADYAGNFMIRNVTQNTFDYTVPPGTSAAPSPAGATVTRINGGLATIQLADLAPGTYQVSVITKNSAGEWQTPSQAIVSRTWTVAASIPGQVRINEVLAHNVGTLKHNDVYPDLVELFNPGTEPIDLSDWSLSDTADLPRKFIFPAGTILGGGEHLVLYGDTLQVAGELHLGYSLKDEGDQVYLFKSPALGGELADSVVFGRQIADYSIGRDAQGTWTLTRPTFGAANVVQSTGDTDKLRINEWLAHEKILFADDFVELHNGDTLPVDISGLYLTNNLPTPAHQAYLHSIDPENKAPRSIAPLSFIGADSALSFIADNNVDAGANHVNFTLSPVRGVIGLLDRNFETLDVVWYGSQTTDISQGRTPDGGDKYISFDLPHPGVGNPGVTTTVTVDETVTNLLTLANATNKWRYSDNGMDMGTIWRAPAYSDSAWKLGAGLLGYKYGGQSLPAPGQVTTLAADPTNLDSSNHARPYRTYYFRTHFSFDGDPTQITSLTGTMVLDDGAVIYLNGTPIYWPGMDKNATIGYSTYATRTIGTGAIETFSIPMSSIPAGTLHTGDNLLAVEVHQGASNSSDIAFGMSLDARRTITTTTTVITNPIPNRIQDLMHHLRITELMYDPIGGNNYEYIELQNTSDTKTLDLAGVRITNGVEFVFPSMSLAPGAYVLAVANRAAFESRYGTGLNIAGEYIGRLDGTGENVTLKLPAPYEAAMLRFDYEGDWYPQTNGTGKSLVVVNAAGPQASWGHRESWRPSVSAGGSPGEVDQGTPTGSVVINEVLPLASQPGHGWIELHNTTAEAIDVSGWFLSDDQASLTKYVLPAGSTIPKDGYLLVPEADFASAMSLHETGGAVYLTNRTAAGEAGQYRESAAYGAAEVGVSFGRYTTSTGATPFVALSAPTPQAANATAKVGPVVISEIMYHPAGGNEYIELHNITGEYMLLYDVISGSGWMLQDAVQYTFALGSAIPANGYALVVDTDPAIFRSAYSIPDSVPVFGPWTGTLKNEGEQVVLTRPGLLQPAPAPLPYVVVDRVWYNDKAPWPEAADGQGASLVRRSAFAYGDDVANWAAEPAGGSPGRANLAQWISGTAGNDAFYLRTTGENLEVFVNVDPRQQPGATPAYQYRLDAVAELRIDGGSGQDSVNLLSALPWLPSFVGTDGDDQWSFFAGTYTLAGDLNAASANARLWVGGTAQVNLQASQHLAELTIEGDGVVALQASGDRLVRTAELAITGNGRLDLADNRMVAQSSAAGHAADLESITALIASGRHGGTWDGTGLGSSAAASDPDQLSGLGVLLNRRGDNSPLHATFGGESVDENSILIGYTISGDLDLSGVIDADDYFQIDRGLLSHAAGYANGDADYSTAIDAEDYLLMDRAMWAQSRPQGSMGAAAAMAAPEIAAPRKTLFSDTPVRTRHAARVTAAADRKKAKKHRATAPRVAAAALPDVPRRRPIAD